MSLQETTKENYCTPTIGTHAKCEGDTLNDTVDVSSGDEDLDDRGNAIEFHNLMKLKGHVFKTCGGELLWYDPDEGVYQEENKPMLLKLDNLLGNCTALGTRYRGNSGKKSALRKELKNLVPQENDFYKKSQENTKGFFAFKNCIWDFKEHKDLPFSPNFYFTFKASVEYNKHDAPFEDEVRKNVFESIFGAGEKCELRIQKPTQDQLPHTRFPFRSANSRSRRVSRTLPTRTIRSILVWKGTTELCYKPIL